MSSWFEIFSSLTNYISIIGGSPNLCNQVSNIILQNCRNQDDYKIFMKSEIFHVILKLYKDKDDDILHHFSFKIMSALIGRSLALSKEDNIGLTFLLKLISTLKETGPALEHKDPLYNKCKRILVRMGPSLVEGEQGTAEFFDFFNEILLEVHSGMRIFLETCSGWPDLSSLVIYLCYIEKLKKNLGNMFHGFKLLVDVMDSILSRGVKDDINVYIDQLKVITRLARLFTGGEEHLQCMLNSRYHQTIEVAILSIESDKYHVFETWLHEQRMVSHLFYTLIKKLDGLLQQLNDMKQNPSTLVMYGHYMKIARKISYEVAGGADLLENLLKERKEEEYIMSKMFDIIVHRYCSDDNLEVLPNLIDVADYELTNLFAVGIIPKMKEGMSFEIEIDRQTLMKASMESILNATCNQLSGSLFVKFREEEGIGSGIIREWLFLVFREMFNPRYKYFKCDGADRHKFFPTLDHVDSLTIYIFFGRLMALALLHHVQLGVTLDPILVVILADIEVTMKHVQNSDPNLYQTMNGYVHSHAVSILPNLLQPDQMDNEDVKRKLMADITREYSKSIVNDYLVDLITEKVTCIKDGIDYIFGPQRRRMFFRTVELSYLDMIICGDPEELSVEDWKNHTTYEECEKDDLHICSFWKIVKEFSADQKRDLLFLWTAIRFLPPGGFTNLEFHPIIRTAEVQKYPNASTCNYTLYIPHVPYEVLKFRLHTTIQQPTCFGFQ